MIKLTAVSANSGPGPQIDRQESFVKSTNCARDLIKAANSQGLQIIQDAQQEAEAIRQRAFADGYQQAVQKAAASITAFVDQEKQQLFASKESILSLALRIAQDVTLTAVQVDRTSLLKRIERALGLLTARERLVVAVNPADIELVAAQQELISSTNNGAKLELVQDPSITIGAARLETGNATIQVNPLEHLERYKLALLSQSNEA